MGSAISHDELTPPADSHLLRDLLGAAVVDETGRSLGAVMELRGLSFEQIGLEVGRIRVTSIVFGPRRVGGKLGYTTLTDQSPRLLARFFIWWHRDDRQATWTDIADLAGRAYRRSGHVRGAASLRVGLGWIDRA